MNPSGLTPQQALERDQRVQALWVGAPRIMHARMLDLHAVGAVERYVSRRDMPDPEPECVAAWVETNQPGRPPCEGFYLFCRDPIALRAQLDAMRS